MTADGDFFPEFNLRQEEWSPSVSWTFLVFSAAESVALHSCVLFSDYLPLYNSYTTVMMKGFSHSSCTHSEK